jgi:hypothetical protein
MSQRERLLDQALENLLCGWRGLVFGNPRMPANLWHYTTAPGVKAILRSQVLWLMAQPPEDGEGDQLETRWGREQVIATCRAFLLDCPLPAVSRMLDDPEATLFGKEQETFVACFTPKEDQWAVRGSAAALVFDSAKLHRHSAQLQSHRLCPVRYGESSVREPTELLLRTTSVGLQQLGSMTDVEEKLVAQHLMDLDVLSFFSKQKSFDWEDEWRLVKRGWAAAKLMKEGPRRVELSIDDPACGLIRIVMAPGSIHAHVDEVSRLASGLPYSVPVTIAIPDNHGDP